MVLVFVLVNLIWVADEAGHWKPRPQKRQKRVFKPVLIFLIGSCPLTSSEPVSCRRTVIK